jgi:hypothetical protein
MNERAKRRDQRYRAWLREILGHLRDGRRRDAAAVIDRVPDGEVRDFCFFLSEHVEADLDQLRREVANHTAEIMARDMPSQN